MKNDGLRTSLVLYGEIEASPSKWWEWYLYARGLNAKLGRNPHYVSVAGDSFPLGTILTIAGGENRIKKAAEKGEHFQYLSIYSMPEPSMPAGFDHITYMLRTVYSEPSRILITLLPEVYLKLDVDGTINDLRKLIGFNRGQIFEMSISEFPFGYVMKEKHTSIYKTLKIIKDF